MPRQRDQLTIIYRKVDAGDRGQSLARQEARRRVQLLLALTPIRPSAELSVSTETSRSPLSIAACKAGVSV